VVANRACIGEALGLRAGSAGWDWDWDREDLHVHVGNGWEGMQVSRVAVPPPVLSGGPQGQGLDLCC
jgi:hypothetical protein